MHCFSVANKAILEEESTILFFQEVIVILSGS